MAYKMGYRATVGLAPETTYGTAVAPTEFLEIKGSTLSFKQAKQVLGDLISGGAYRSKIVSLNKSVGGDISLPVNPDSGLGWILKSFCNASPTSAVLSGSAYGHTFLGSGASDVISKGSLTIQQVIDDYAQDYTGCVTSAIKLSVSAGGLLEMSASFVGKDMAIQGSPTSASFSTQLPITYGTVAITKGGSAITVKSAEVTLENGVSGGGDELGSFNIRKVERGVYTVKGTLELYFEDNTYYTDFINNNNFALVISADNGTAIASTYKYALNLTLGKCYIVDNPIPEISGKGAFVQRVAFEAVYKDSTDQDFKFVLQNSKTSYA
jgi:hypothetical protein